jgi:hypothetical protein
VSTGNGGCGGEFVVSKYFKLSAITCELEKAWSGMRLFSIDVHACIASKCSKGYSELQVLRNDAAPNNGPLELKK